MFSPAEGWFFSVGRDKNENPDVLGRNWFEKTFIVKSTVMSKMYDLFN